MGKSTFESATLSVLAYFGAEVFVKGPCRSLVLRVAVPSRLALRALLEVLAPRRRTAMSTPGNSSAVVPSVLRPLSYGLEPIVIGSSPNPLRQLWVLEIAALGKPFEAIGVLEDRLENKEAATFVAAADIPKL
jgi:hypothetical protein